MNQPGGRPTSPRQQQQQLDAFGNLWTNATSQLNDAVIARDQAAKGTLANEGEVLENVEKFRQALREKLSQISACSDEDRKSAAIGLNEMREELLKVSRQREAKMNTAREKKEEIKMIRRSVDAKLKELKEQLESMAKERQELEEQLTKEQEHSDLPAVLKLMRS